MGVQGKRIGWDPGRVTGHFVGNNVWVTHWPYTTCVHWFRTGTSVPRRSGYRLYLCIHLLTRWLSEDGCPHLELPVLRKGLRDLEQNCNARTVHPPSCKDRLLFRTTRDSWFSVSVRWTTVHIPCTLSRSRPVWHIRCYQATSNVSWSRLTHSVSDKLIIKPT